MDRLKRMATEDEDLADSLHRHVAQVQQYEAAARLLQDAPVAHHRCRAPLLEECPQHHGHKGDPEVTPGTCGAIGEKAQVILVWVRAPGSWERLPPTETRSHEGKA